MADINALQKIVINEKEFNIIPCWEAFGISKEYMLALLCRDEYTPVLERQPTETDTLYIDPASGNPAGFHSGQCVIYPDNTVVDKWGLSIAKMVELDDKNIPTKVYWLHITDIEKNVMAIKSNIGYWNNGDTESIKSEINSQ